jgi:hypothetical protein
MNISILRIRSGVRLRRYFLVFWQWSLMRWPMLGGGIIILLRRHPFQKIISLQTVDNENATAGHMTHLQSSSTLRSKLVIRWGRGI